MSGPRQVVDLPDIEWRWDGHADVWTDSSQFGGYRMSEEVDPTPGYAHDAGLVRETLERVAAVFPISWPVSFYLLHHDTLKRTNGWTNVELGYKAAEKPPYPLYARVCLAGKRIPPHPAMTRYLVAHEYGHVVERWIAHCRGLAQDERKILAEYAELRQLELQPGYGPGLWHRSVGEVFACDFRLVVAGVEEEFWPHPGVERPGQAVLQWWAAAAEACRAAAAAPQEAP